MRCVIQRVSQASVAVNNKKEAIEEGYCVFIAVAQQDLLEDIEYCAKKVANLRIMSDEKQKMNKNLKDVNGEVLLISQFTLYANTSKGNRPSFVAAAEPEKAKKYYQMFYEQIKSHGIPVKTGEFGAYMKVMIHNDGPVTIIIDSEMK